MVDADSGCEMSRYFIARLLLLASIFAGSLGGMLPHGHPEALPAGARPELLHDRARTADQGAARLLAAGDIAVCGDPDAAKTGALLRKLPGTVATLGDNAYESGSSRDFAACYDPTWGAVRGRTRPAVGNHEYESRAARPYFAYFGAAAGSQRDGFYSYDLGAWHIVVLNSNCAKIGGCGADSRQGRWLREDLAAHPARCALAYWHHPLFSSGSVHGGDAAMRPIWQLLYDAGVDVVLSAHEHNYERFAPQDANGRPDPERGIREFVVGTGGASHYPFGAPLPLSEKRNATTFGVLSLVLKLRSYRWEFIPVATGSEKKDGKPFTDAGRAECH